MITQNLILKCGVRADLKGFNYLAEAVGIFSKSPHLGFCKIYKTVAEKHGVKYKTVMREISYAISQAFNLAQSLSKIVGIHIPAAEIHSSLVIAYLGKAVQQQISEEHEHKDAE